MMQLAGFTESAIKTRSNPKELQAQYAAAIKMMDAENRRKLGDNREASSKRARPAAKAATGREIQDGKLVFDGKGFYERVAIRAGHLKGTA